ncbi:hypothetical protein KSP40_PGU014176 [Platanthera guangdongensis]|uniref:Uncharacterized protein n=1 Tax=Platanthera guangdongensis TaxID=2320717 RepID=A0ABR2MH51_9ASPA
MNTLCCIFFECNISICKDNYCQILKVMRGLIELLGNKDVCNKQKNAMMEVRFFHDQLENFGKSLSIKIVTKIQLDEYTHLFCKCLMFFFEFLNYNNLRIIFVLFLSR